MGGAQRVFFGVVSANSASLFIDRGPGYYCAVKIIETLVDILKPYPDVRHEIRSDAIRVLATNKDTRSLCWLDPTEADTQFAWQVGIWNSLKSALPSVRFWVASRKPID